MVMGWGSGRVGGKRRHRQPSTCEPDQKGSFLCPRPTRLTLDLSCPRLGGMKPARSRDRRQDARSSRAMADWV